MVYRPLRYEQIMRAAEAYDVRARRMFGGMGVYTGEKMFAFLIGEDIGFKLSPDDIQEALKLPGSGPMKPDADMEPMREYVKMPRDVLDNMDVFMFWLDKSANYARQKAARVA
ncbi:TfoX Regulator of competence-specific genes [Fimbriimonadaceae bacterium]